MTRLIVVVLILATPLLAQAQAFLVPEVAAEQDSAAVALAQAQAELAVEVAAERAAAAAAMARADSLASQSLAMAFQAAVDADSSLAGLDIEVASPGSPGASRDPLYVDMVIVGYDAWDAATRRLWRATLAEAGSGAISRGEGRYTVHRADVAAVAQCYRSFRAAMAAEEVGTVSE